MGAARSGAVPEEAFDFLAPLPLHADLNPRGQPSAGRIDASHGASSRGFPERRDAIHVGRPGADSMGSFGLAKAAGHTGVGRLRSALDLARRLATVGRSVLLALSRAGVSLVDVWPVLRSVTSSKGGYECSGPPTRGANRSDGQGAWG